MAKAHEKPVLRWAIRPATVDDADFVVSLAPRFVAFELPKGRGKRDTLAAIRADLRRALHEPRADDCFFVIEGTAGKLVGFVHLQIQRDFFSGARTCHISDLASAAGHDDEGIGHALLAHAQGWAKRNRCALLTLSVFPGNSRARRLYEHTGFALDLLRMTKPIRQGGTRAAHARKRPRSGNG